MESVEEIEKIIKDELKGRRIRKDTLVYKMYGKPFKELTKEEQRKYWVEKHRIEMQDENKKIAKREYERKRYKRRREYMLMKSKERHVKNKMSQ